MPATNEVGLGRYLAQGWAANAIFTYLLLLTVCLLSPSRDDWGALLVVAPIYCSIIGAIGMAVAAMIWFSSVFTRKGRINILYRAAAAILIPFLLTTTILALFGVLREPIVLLFAIPPVLLVLPAALLSGSRVNPLRFVVMDLRRDLPKYGWSRALSIVIVPLLRFTSALGILETLLYLALLRSSALGAWDVAEKEFAGAIVAVVYFAVTFSVSLCLPQRNIITPVGILANAPVAMYALMAPASFDYQFIAFIGWILVGLWTLLIASRFRRSETRRLIPVTMLEIRMRHAFNYWQGAL